MGAPMLGCYCCDTQTKNEFITLEHLFLLLYCCYGDGEAEEEDEEEEDEEDDAFGVLSMAFCKILRGMGRTREEEEAGKEEA